MTQSENAIIPPFTSNPIANTVCGLPCVSVCTLSFSHREGIACSIDAVTKWQQEERQQICTGFKMTTTTTTATRTTTATTITQQRQKRCCGPSPHNICRCKAHWSEFSWNYLQAWTQGKEMLAWRKLTRQIQKLTYAAATAAPAAAQCTEEALSSSSSSWNEWQQGAIPKRYKKNRRYKKTIHKISKCRKITYEKKENVKNSKKRYNKENTKTILL